VLCTTITLDLANSLGTTTTAALFIGLTQADLSTAFGGHLLLLPISTIVLSLPAAGIGLPGVLPCDPSLCGLSVYLQALEIDGGASRGGVVYARAAARAGGHDEFESRSHPDRYRSANREQVRVALGTELDVVVVMVVVLRPGG
jgi:hypothetical protein